MHLQPSSIPELIRRTAGHSLARTRCVCSFALAVVSTGVFAQQTGFEEACLATPTNLRFFTEVPLFDGNYRIPTKDDPEYVWPRYHLLWDRVTVPASHTWKPHYEVWDSLSDQGHTRRFEGGMVFWWTSWSGSYKTGFIPPFQQPADLGFFSVGTQYFWIRPTVLNDEQFQHWIAPVQFGGLGATIESRNTGQAWTFTGESCANCTPEYINSLNATLFCDSNFAGPFAVVASQPIAAPESLTAAKTSDTQVRVVWNAVTSPAAATYQVFRAAGFPPLNEKPMLDRLWGFPTTSIERQYARRTLQGTLVKETTSTEFLDNPPGAGSYTYWVRVKDSCFSSVSATVDLFTAISCNQNPASVTATQGAFADKVIVTWPSAPDAISYLIWRSLPGVGFSRIGQVTGLEFSDTNVERNQEYLYMVTGVSADCGESTFNSAQAVGWPQHAVPQLTGVFPESAPNDRLVPLTVVGSGFVRGATVRLVRDGQPDILPLTDSTVTSETQLAATFDLTGKTPGVWNVKVINIETEAELQNAFTIVQGYKPVYANDFSDPPTPPPGPEWSKPTTDSSPAGEKFLGQFGAETVTLTIDDLPEHTRVRIDLSLLLLKSWDGNGNACCGPDTWKLEIENGPTLLNTSFSNTGESGNRQSYPQPVPFGNNAARTGAAANNTLGYGSDSIYNLTYEFAHTASRLVIKFIGTPTQGIEDESWGLDNILVRTTTAAVQPLPLPTPNRQVYLWTGAVRTDPSNWDNPGNWNPFGVPSGFDIAVIGPPAASGTVNAPGDRAVHRIDLQGSGATLNAGSIFASEFNFGAGNFTGTCLIDSNGRFNWAGGTLSGNVTLLSGAQGDVFGENPRRMNGNNSYSLENITVQSDAKLRWHGAAPIDMYTAALIRVFKGGTFVIEGGAPVLNYIGGNLGALWIEGSLVKSSTDPNAATLPEALLIELSGRMASERGTLRVNSRLNLYNGSRLEGGADGRIELGGNVVNTGTAPDQINPVAVHNVFIAGAHVQGDGTLSIIGNSSWTSGTLSGKIAIGAGGTLHLIGPEAKRINGNNSGTLHNLIVQPGGVLNWNGGVNESGGPLGLIQMYTAPVIHVQADAAFNLMTDGTVFSYIGGNAGVCLIQPGGAFVKKEGTGINVVTGVNFLTSGRVEAKAGVISFQQLLQLTTEPGAEFHGPGLSRVDGGTLDFQASTVTLHGPLEMAAGTLIGTGTLQGSGAFDWSGGQISGSVAVASGGTLNIQGSNPKRLNGNNSETHLNIINSGTLNLSGSGDIQGYTAAVILNRAGGTMNLIGDLNLTYIGGNHSVIRNAGLLRKTGGGRSQANFKLNNEPGGTVLAVEGTTAWNAGGSSSGEPDKPCLFDALAPAAIEFTGGEETITGPARFVGAGTSRIAGGTVRFVGASFVGGENTPGNFEIVSGTLSGSEPLIVHGDGELRWTGGTIAGAIIARAEGELLIHGPELKRINGNNSYTLRNVTIEPGGVGIWREGLIQLYTAAVIDNQGGAFQIQSDGQIFSYIGGNSGAFFNSGTLRKTGGPGEAVINQIQFHNQPNGSVLSESGTIHFQTAVTLSNGSQISGTGASSAVLFSSGTVTASGLPDLLADPVFVRNIEFTGSALLEGNGAVAVKENVHWTGGTIAGRVRLLSGSESIIRGSNSLRLNGNNSYSLINILVEDNARLRWQGPARINTYTAAIIQVLKGAVFSVESSGDLTGYIGGNTSVLRIDGTLRRSGTDLTVIPDAIVDLTGLLTADQGSLRINSQLNLFNGSQTHGNAPGLIELGGTVRNVGTPEEQPNPALGDRVFLTGGTVDGNGTLAIVGNAQWTGGTLAGKILVTESGIFTLAGSAAKRINGNNSGTLLNLANAGTLIFEGTGPVQGYTFAVLENTATGRIAAAPGTDFTYIGGNRSLLRNAGTMRIGSLTQIGTVTLSNWLFEQASSGAIQLDAAGPNATTGYSRLAFSQGQTTLNGAVRIEVAESFVPDAAQPITPITWSSRSGTFGSVQVIGPTVASFETEYTTTALSLKITGQPLNLPPAFITPDGRFAGTLRGSGGTRAILQASTDLIHWDDVSDPQPFSGVFGFTNGPISEAPYRFFRLLILP
ncbi:MAG: hypothetical protein AB1813_16415 [Verrucomicrobiota bacterium]